ncbi:MAG: pyridoxal phosphate-dependent aminotransferase [Candidatus Diapherotrites archaeon]
MKASSAKKFERDNNLHYELNQINCGAGGKQTLFNAFLAVLNEGDEVILASPYWVSYTEQINFAKAKPKIIKTTGNFKLKAVQVKEAITDKTKVILLNSPSNPAGAVIDETELKKIAETAVENDLIVFSDEVYESFNYEGKNPSIASYGKEIFDRTITFNAVSKSHTMTGWRLGYCGGPKEIISAMNSLQSHSTSNPCSIAQKAAIEALIGQQETVKEMKKEFLKRRNLMISLLNEIKGIHCPTPGGAFYCFPNISKTGMNSMEFTEKLLNEALVAVVPGIAFGDDECIRLSYAVKEEEIRKGLKRMKEWVEK